MSNPWLYVPLALMTFLAAAGSLFFKRAAGSSSFVTALQHPDLYIGVILYVTSAAMNIVMLRYLPYTTVLPLTGLNYVWTIILAHFVLKERVTIRKVAGVGMIMLGAALIV